MSVPDFVIGREDFSRRLSEELGKKFAYDCSYRAFRHEYHPDGEPAPRIKAEYKEMEGAHVVLVLRGSQLPIPNRVSRNLHNFSRHIDNLKYVFGAKDVDVLMPYYWLGRQDKNPKTDTDRKVRKIDHGRDVGYEWLARDFKAHGANRIITFNPHFNREAREPFKVCDIEVAPLSGIPALARYVRELYEDGLISEDAILTGPDFGSSPLLEEFAAIFGKKFELFEKNRMGGEHVKASKKTDMYGRDVIIIDDLISTLGTIEEAVRNMHNVGNIDCFGVHGVFPESGFNRVKSLRRNVRWFAVTDTIDTDYSEATVMPEVVEFYKQNS